MNIHDTNFKHNFEKKNVAKDFLLHNLPKKALTRIDIATLNIESNEFIPSRYRTKRSADIVYSVKNKKGEKIYALLHLEGQSTHDKHMGIRIWEYHAAIAKSHLRQGNPKVPLILTFVLYHGKAQWSSATSIADLFDDFDLYMDVSLKSTFLINLHEKKIEELKQQGASSGPQLIMKAQPQGDYCKALEHLYPLLKAHDLLDEENIDYMATNDQHEPEEFLKKLSNFEPEKSNHYNTITMLENAVQRIVKKRLKTAVQTAVQKTAIEYKTIGRKEGKLEGKLEGKKEGRKESDSLWIKKIKEAQSKGLLDSKLVKVLLN